MDRGGPPQATRRGRAAAWLESVAIVAGAVLAALALPVLGAYLARAIVPELTGVGIVLGAAIGWPIALWLAWQPRRR